MSITEDAAGEVFRWSFAVDVLICLLIGNGINLVASVNTEIKQRICNGDRFPNNLGSDFRNALFDLMRDLMYNTLTAPACNYYNQNKHATATFYGHGKCQGGTTGDSCDDSILSAYRQMFSKCTHSVGAQIKLVDCCLRYEEHEYVDYC